MEALNFCGTRLNGINSSPLHLLPNGLFVLYSFTQFMPISQSKFTTAFGA
jgi:hypothetical protein